VEEIAAHPDLRRLLLRYGQFLFSQVSQTAACNARHSLYKRLARWLLESHDRSHSDTLTLRHEFLSDMLSARRAGVTIALGELREAGAVDLRRGAIVITDRRRLEAEACECYATVRGAFNQLLPKI
jgi:CRP-like cAMP-binding protein